jgi:hypothetical protein
MSVVLWNADSGNKVADFPAEGAALAAVHQAIERHGEQVADALVLIRIVGEGENERSETIAEGRELAERARRSVARL